MTDPKPQAPLPLERIDATLNRDPLLGAQLGEYLVQERLGAGGMGVVYGGIQPMIGKRVAIKVLQWDLARNPEEAQRLLAEARLVNAIRHRGIVDIFSSGELPDGRHYLVMELLEGDPLDKVIADRAPLAVNEVLQILEEVCDALAAAHGAGVIHRDLKPNNIFFVNPQHGARYCKLLDFGLAKKSLNAGGKAAQTRASMVVGTPYYMAPEQARGEPVSPQTDLYSMGVMSFEMLTGKLPFDAPTPFEVITMHLNSPAPLVSSLERSVPPDLDEIIAQMLNKVPSQRPPSAEYVRRELAHIKNRLQTDATHVGVSPLGTETPTTDMPALQDIPLPDPTVAQPLRPVSRPPHEAVQVRTLEYGIGPNAPGKRVSRVARADLPKDLRVSKARPKRSYTGLKVGAALLGVMLLGGVAFLYLNPQAAAALPFKIPFLPASGALDIPEPLPDKPEPTRPDLDKAEPNKPEPDAVRPDQPKKLTPPTLKHPDAKPVTKPAGKEPATQAVLLKRLNDLLRPMEQKRAAGGEVDNLKFQLLVGLRERAEKAAGPERRAEVERELHDYEVTFNR